jgi:hypothetical protein
MQVLSATQKEESKEISKEGGHTGCERGKEGQLEPFKTTAKIVGIIHLLWLHLSS